MKKIFLLLIFLLVIGYSYAQWQEIIQYGKVKDFLYIDSNLQYIWGDTNYIVENGQPRLVANFGFVKKNGDIWTPDQVDFVKGTRIGYKIKCNFSTPIYEVYRTIDGGISWEKFADGSFNNYTLLWMIPTVVDSNTVLIEGRYLKFSYPDNEQGFLPLIKVNKNNKIDIIYPKIYYGSKWYTLNSGSYGDISSLYFFDPLYGIGLIHGGNYVKSGLVRTMDGGKNFMYLDSIRDKSNGKMHPVSKKDIYSINQYSISLSSDSGFTWNWIKRDKIVNSNYDTLYSGLSVTKDQIFYLKGNLFKNPYQTVSYLFSKKLIDPDFDSVVIKPVKYIEYYDKTKCYMYDNHFYINNNAKEHPLSDEMLNQRTKSKIKLKYIVGQNMLIFSSVDNNVSYKLRLYDISGKLLSEDETKANTGQFSYSIKENLPQGIYIVNLLSLNNNYSAKYMTKLFYRFQNLVC